MTRTLHIAAPHSLCETLAEQFAPLSEFALAASETPWPDALVLDDRSGDAPARIEDWRRRGFDGAVILLADACAPSGGADATLARPFRFAALIEAIRLALARRQALVPAAAGGARLTEKEAAILAHLARANGAPVSRAELLAQVWGYGPSVSTRTLETHIHRLRRKIEGDPAQPRRLLTAAGGYRLAGAK